MRKALIVGINYYSQIRGLYGCVNDARAVKKRAPSGTVTARSTSPSSFSSRPRATNDAIGRSRLKDLVNELFAEDHEVALLYFAGHGRRGADPAVICAQRFQQGRRRPLAREVMTLANQSPARNKVDLSRQLPFRNRRHSARSKDEPKWPKG